MPDSVRELIIQNMVTVLRTITTANGYQNNLTSGQVQRWNPNGQSMVTVPALIVGIGSEEKRDTKSKLTECRMNVLVDVWTRHDEDSATAADKVLNDLVWDIEKALMADVSRGGYARDTTLQNVTPFETVEGEPHMGISLGIEIHYAHVTTDPATAG